jgi:hypothetical protein
MKPANSAASPLYRRFVSLLVVLCAGLPAVIWDGPRHAAQAASPAITGLHVQGNQILNGNGQPLRLLGVDRSGTQDACIQGWGIFDGPNDAASVQAIASWHTNAVRVPLNEDCWLGINGAPAAYSGMTYQQAIADYVNLLNQNGLIAILEMHYAAPGAAQSVSQLPMPDKDHAPAFWSSVATYFKANTSVIFDLYNEPYPDNNQDTTAAWTCWRDGGACSGVAYQVAGMQELVTTVRATGATNIIMLGGVGYAGTLDQWLAYEPADPTGNLAASWHNYDFTGCTTQACWNTQAAPVAQKVPLITGEIGETDCGHGYIDGLMAWLDSLNISYLAWTWDTWNCSTGPALITDYSGTPTAYGAGYQAHLAALAAAPPTLTSPASATPFHTLAVTGANFGAGEQVSIYWDSTATTPLASAAALGDGSFGASVAVPQATAGPHTLIAVGQTSGKTASAPVQVTPSVYLFPASGTAGSVAYLVGVGFGASERVAAIGYPGFALLNAASSNTAGTAIMAFLVPASAPGVVYVIGYGVTSRVYAYAPFTVTAASTAGQAGPHQAPVGPPPPPPYPITLN